MSVSLDHFMWAGSNLDALVERFAALSGTRPLPGGHHPGNGTQNALASLGNGSYIELIAPDSDAGKQGFLGELFKTLSDPQVMFFLLRTNDLSAVQEAYGKWDIDSKIIDMERRTPQGQTQQNPGGPDAPYH